MDEALFEVPTVKTMIALHDNYEPVVTEEEDVTREEIQEEWAFLDAVIDTKVCKRTAASSKAAAVAKQQ